MQTQVKHLFRWPEMCYLETGIDDARTTSVTSNKCVLLCYSSFLISWARLYVRHDNCPKQVVESSDKPHQQQNSPKTSSSLSSSSSLPSLWISHRACFCVQNWWAHPYRLRSLPLHSMIFEIFELFIFFCIHSRLILPQLVVYMNFVCKPSTCNFYT